MLLDIHIVEVQGGGYVVYQGAHFHNGSGYLNIPHYVAHNIGSLTALLEKLCKESKEKQQKIKGLTKC